MQFEDWNACDAVSTSWNACDALCPLYAYGSLNLRTWICNLEASWARSVAVRATSLVVADISDVAEATLADSLTLFS
ncbi:MAG: hypothetical protein LBQ86_01705, partial [Holophagales bacterium]|nr:hypothetical protein [Holophagales bacterium]